MNLIVNIPPVKVWVRKEYLTDHTEGHGEFVEGYWVTAKSLPGRTFYFETYLPEYGAMYEQDAYLVLFLASQYCQNLICR